MKGIRLFTKIFGLTQVQFLMAFLLTLLAGDTSYFLATREPASIRAIRLNHAEELLGETYLEKYVPNVEDGSEIYKFIHFQTAKALPKTWKTEAYDVANAIIKESQRHHLDPFFLMAVIQTESSFIPTQKGSAGEIGLMQILPRTAKWIVKKMNLTPYEEIETALSNPVENIKIGAAYFAMLRSKFLADGRLYISAYNMGAANVYKLLSKSIRPKKYSSKVMKHYLSFYTEYSRSLAMRSSTGGWVYSNATFSG